MLELIIIFLLIFIGVQEYFNRKERGHLNELIVSKSLREVGELEAIRKVKPEKQKKEKPDSIPLASLDDKQFDELIKRQNEKS